MMIARISEDNKLRPNWWGHKLELADRGSQFQKGDFVLELEVTHDTKPLEENKGVKFIKVRKFKKEDIEPLVKEEIIDYKYAINTISSEEIVLDKVYIFTIYTWKIHWSKPSWCGEEVFREEKFLSITPKELEVDYIWGGTIRIWGTVEGERSLIIGEKELKEEIAKRFFAIDIEKEKRKEEKEEEKRKKEEEKRRRKVEEEEHQLIQMFFKEHPEAKNWFNSPPTWGDLTDQIVAHKMATFKREKPPVHYASWSTSDGEEYIRIKEYSIKIGEEEILFDYCD